MDTGDYGLPRRMKKKRRGASQHRAGEAKCQGELPNLDKKGPLEYVGVGLLLRTKEVTDGEDRRPDDIHVPSIFRHRRSACRVRPCRCTPFEVSRTSVEELRGRY